MALIGLDTNVLLRAFVRDDEIQTAKVAKLIAGRKEADVFFVNVAVILEFSWVLSRFYKYPRAAVLSAIRSLLERRDLEVEHYQIVGDAAALCEDSKCDYSDAVIGLLNKRNGCTHTLTFDKIAADSIHDMELLS
jgi:predicted nucleic-acid-binding protein